MIKINGTTQIKTLIRNIVTDLNNVKVTNSHVDYSIALAKNNKTKCSLLTDKNGDNLRNVSILNVNRIRAAIGNNTGNILINYKPFFMSTKKAVSKICKFLELIQNTPKKCIKPYKVEFNEANFSLRKKQYDFNEKNKLVTEITGSDSTKTWECFEEYIKL